jgi:hypothetical protein
MMKQQPYTHINRRAFMKGIGAMGILPFLPVSVYSEELDYNAITFDRNIYENNNAQTIIVYLYGGPSELAGNMTNIEEIDKLSQNPYPLGDDRYISLTQDKLWSQAGGDAMQRMLDNGDLNLFRTCYRTVDDNKAHGECTSQAQKGSHLNDGAGILAKLGAVLYNKGVLSEPSGQNDIGKSIPFVTMEGESTFFFEDTLNIQTFLKPAAFGSSSDNPYVRINGVENRILNSDTNQTVGNLFDAMAQRFNFEGSVKDAFDKRALLEQFTKEINEATLPSGVSYPDNNIFAERMETAMKLLIMNPDTKVVSMGSPGLGGWDDHSNAISNYTHRMTQLMEAIETAMEHMQAEGRSNINIVVFGEFGRNTNYNDSLGWDHGNLQNVYWFGGKDYMNRLGIVGETEVTGGNGRIFQRPKNFGTANASYHFQVFSIAATLYKLYGITNPEILTEGNPIIKDLLS